MTYTYHVVIAGATPRLVLASFTQAEGGEPAARAFARMHKEACEVNRMATGLPQPQLEIDVVLTKSETIRTIRL